MVRRQSKSSGLVCVGMLSTTARVSSETATVCGAPVSSLIRTTS